LKPVLDWVKGNIVIVILSVVILAMLPTAWFLSNMWDKKIKAQQEQAAKDQYQKIAGLKVNYTLPALDSKAQPVSHNEVPNLALINWFKEQRGVLTAQATSVIEKAEQFNQGIGKDAQSVGRTEHKPLVEDVFPAGNQSKLEALEDALLGNRGRPNPYLSLLQDARAGEPAPATALAESLEDFRAREVEKITAGKRDLTDEEEASLLKLLTERRLGEYQNRASQISVYANMESLPGNRQYAFVPTGAHLDQQFINLSDMFLFQWDYWVLRDLFAAVKVANSQGSRLANVDQAVVKRVESIEMSLPTGINRGGQGANPEYNPADPMATAPVAPPPATAAVPLDFNFSITGRLAANSVYDVRSVSMTVVVSSARLADFVSAIERTNFMTVTDMDLTEVNVYEDLNAGYYYGNEHVVRANLTIETVWLRSWMTKYMPDSFKSNLKIEVPGAAPTDGSVPPAETAPGAG